MKIGVVGNNWLNKLVNNWLNCKKTTRHDAHQSLCAKSRETNDVKSRK